MAKSLNGLEINTKYINIGHFNIKIWNVTCKWKSYIYKKKSRQADYVWQILTGK
jgi:hypothetical protein